MQQILNWMRRLVYPTAIVFLLWAGYQVVASPNVSQSDGRILAVYDSESTVPDCDKARDMTPDNENISASALIGLCRAARTSAGHGPEVALVNIHDALDHPLELRTTKIF